MLVSVRKGLTYMIPLLILGSFALLILSLPIPGYQELMNGFFGQGWGNLFLFVRDGTFNILSMLMVICISYAYVDELGQENNISPIIASSVSLASYIAMSGINSDSFSIHNFAANGIFMAIAVSAASTWIFARLSMIKLLKIRAYTNGANSSFNYALTSIFPAGITVALFAAINSMLAGYLHITNIQLFIQGTFSNIFLKLQSPFLSGILFVLLVHIMWFFGIHGSNVLEPATQMIFAPGTDTNALLLQNGHSPQVIFTKTFFDSFVLMGGCGAAFCLVAAILLVGRHKNNRRLAKLSFLPLLLNINELIVFGIPIVLNPVFLIPFIGVPLLLTITSYLAMYIGLVPFTVHTVEWTTPILLSGYISTQSVSGSILQLFNFALGVLCYIPFVRLSESSSEKQLQLNLQKVCNACLENEKRGYPSALLSRHDETGNIARFLAADLSEDIKNGKIALYYQPQLNHEGKVFGVEALLRWRNDSYGFIYPPLVIALAEECRLINELGYIIFTCACKDLQGLIQSGYGDISLSVNVSAVQLEDDEFIPKLSKIIDEYHVPSSSLKIEITEQVALSGSKKVIDQIEGLKAMGIKLSLDDFGMGHNSLKYLKEYSFDTIKLDGSLVREVADDLSCQNIISSIIYLSKSMNCTIIAEYVEEVSQRNTLYQLGCEQYQGYLYSKPLPFDALIKYLK